jgi:hypothetical protein
MLRTQRHYKALSEERIQNTEFRSSGPRADHWLNLECPSQTTAFRCDLHDTPFVLQPAFGVTKEVVEILLTHSLFWRTVFRVGFFCAFL